MTTQERFSQEWKMPLHHVRLLVRQAKRAGKCNEHFSNGDPHPSLPATADKNHCAQYWAADVDVATKVITDLVKLYGFTGVEYTGLRPTLKCGTRFVEVPY